MINDFLSVKYTVLKGQLLSKCNLGCFFQFFFFYCKRDKHISKSIITTNKPFLRLTVILFCGQQPVNGNTRGPGHKFERIKIDTVKKTKKKKTAQVAFWQQLYFKSTYVKVIHRQRSPNHNHNLLENVFKFRIDLSQNLKLMAECMVMRPIIQSTFYSV